MYLVICYSIHEQEVCFVTPFKDYDIAYTYMNADAKTCYDEERDNIEPDEVVTIDHYENDKIIVSSYEGARIWTWEIVEVK